MAAADLLTPLWEDLVILWRLEAKPLALVPLRPISKKVYSKSKSIEVFDEDFLRNNRTNLYSPNLKSAMLNSISPISVPP